MRYISYILYIYRICLYVKQRSYDSQLFFTQKPPLLGMCPAVWLCRSGVVPQRPAPQQEQAEGEGRSTRTYDFPSSEAHEMLGIMSKAEGVK